MQEFFKDKSPKKQPKNEKTAFWGLITGLFRIYFFAGTWEIVAEFTEPVIIQRTLFTLRRFFYHLMQLFDVFGKCANDFFIY